jgi:hypothetical protein
MLTSMEFLIFTWVAISLILNVVLGVVVIGLLDRKWDTADWLVFETKSSISMWLWLELWPVLAGKIIIRKMYCRV